VAGFFYFPRRSKKNGHKDAKARRKKIHKEFLGSWCLSGKKINRIIGIGKESKMKKSSLKTPPAASCQPPRLSTRVEAAGEARAGVLLLFCSFALLLFSGCANLRFGATESQKQLALNDYHAAVLADNQGLQPVSPQSKQLVEGTLTSLSYIGLPDNPIIADYNSTLAAAKQDAAKRPTIKDISESVEGGLSLASELAILFGVGGVGFGGKKLSDWIAAMREKNKQLKTILTTKNQALEQIVAGAEVFKNQAAPEAVTIFKDSQDMVQSESTRQIVAALKA